MLVKLQDTGLQTQIDTKPTDKHMYLYAGSEHPNTTKRAILCGLAIRAKRILSDEKGFKQEKINITNQLVKREHRLKDVENALQKTDKVSKNELLNYADTS